MKLFPDSRTFISILGVDIAWYAIIIITGAIIALQLTKRDAAKRGIKKDDVEDIFFGVLLLGILGARIWYVVFHPDKAQFFSDPMKIIAFRDGGLAIQGGIVAGTAYAYYKTKKLNISFIDLADSAAPYLLLAQAIGRWGNFVNQEAYGQVVSEAYFKYFPVWFKEQMFINGNFQQPMFFYESVLNIIGLIVLKFVLPRFRKMKQGDYAYGYLAWYGAVRIWIEHYRSDSLMFFGLKSAQLFSLVFIIVGIMGFMGVFRKDKKSDTLVLFDFDGTLGDTNKVIVNSFVHTFKKYNPELEITEEMKVSFVGPTLQHSFSKYTGLDDVDKYIKEYKRVNFEMQKEELHEIKNATKLLKALKDDNISLGLVSSKMKDSLMLGVTLLKFEDYMEYILGGDEVSTPKPNPEGILKAKDKINKDASKNYYVGDTVTDIKAAQAANFISIAIVTTAHLDEALNNCGADYVIYDLMEIVDIVKE